MPTRQHTAPTLTDLLFERCDAGLCLVAPDGTIVRANREWLRSTGFTLEQVLGADVAELFPQARDMALAVHARARAGHRVEIPRHALAVNGHETWWEGVVEPVPMDGGTGVLVTTREVTPQGPPAELAAEVLEHGDGVFVLDAEYRFVLVNETFERASRMARADVLGRVFWEVFPLAERPESQFATQYRRAMQERVVVRFEETYAPNGTWNEITAYPTRAGGIAVFFRDVTARRTAEDALARQERKYRGLFEHSLDAVYLTDRDGNVLEANAAACALHGMTVDEIRRAGRAGLVVSDQRHASALQDRAASGCVRAEMSVRRKDGTTVPVEVESVLLEPGQPGSAAFVISRDVTERTRVERELREAGERNARQVRLFDGVASTTPDFVYAFDRDGRFLYANRRLLEVWGMPLQDAVGKTCRELGYEQWHHDMHMREIAQVIESKAPIKGEVPFKAPLTGIFGVYEYIFTPVLGPEGEVEFIAGTTRDVTERKRAEAALRDGEQRFATIFHRSPLAIAWTKLPQGTLAAVNEEWVKLTGVSPGEAIGKTTVELGIARPEVRQALHDELLTRGSTELETTLFTRAHGERTILTRAEHVTLHGEQYLLSALQDVTERRRAEEALRAANERLREADRRKDEFLGMLSHELRNPLAPIRYATYVLQHADPGSDQAQGARHVIQRQIEHLTRLVDDLLDVTRIARGMIELRRGRIDLREIVRRTVEDFRPIIEDKGVALRVLLPEAKLWCDGDATRITQVIGNLLHNAAKFTRRGNEVDVTVEADGSTATIRVRDSGAGIDASLLPHVFDPFVQGERTLARSEGGLGLGLALVKGLTEQHGGSVDVSSGGKGKGAEFVVRLPLVVPVAPGRDEGKDHGPRTVARRVLVVDDNADAADSLADILSMLGHAVEVAYDGASALAKARASAPDVVLCDIGLPGMSGYDVARLLRQAGVTARIFAISGYAQPEDVSRALQAGFDGHVAKPPSVEDIERLLA